MLCRCFQLRRLTFAILNKDNLQEAHETYTYRFFYTDAGTVMSGPGTPNRQVNVSDPSITFILCNSSSSTVVICSITFMFLSL